MAAGPALPGLFLVFAAMVLLIFVCVSTPTWNAISFLNVGSVRYGVFGFTGSQTHIGYDFNPAELGLEYVSILQFKSSFAYPDIQYHDNQHENHPQLDRDFSPIPHCRRSHWPRLPLRSLWRFLP